VRPSSPLVLALLPLPSPLQVKNTVEAIKNNPPAINTDPNNLFMILFAILTNFKFRFLWMKIVRTGVIQKDSIYF
jgi:hypothetical protein